VFTKAIAALEANRQVETDRSLMMSEVDYLKHAHENLEHALGLVKEDSKRAASILELLAYSLRRLGRYQDAFKQTKKLIRLRNGDIDSQIFSALGAIAEKNPSLDVENDLIEMCSRRLEMECVELVVYVIATRIVLGTSVAHERWNKWTQILHQNNTLDVPSFRIPEQSVVLSQAAPAVMIVDDVFPQEFLNTLEMHMSENLSPRKSFPTCYIDIPNSEIRRSHRWYQVDRWMCTDDFVETSHSRSSFVRVAFSNVEGMSFLKHDRKQVQHGNRLRKHVLERFESLFGLSPLHACR